MFIRRTTIKSRESGEPYYIYGPPRAARVKPLYVAEGDVAVIYPASFGVSLPTPVP